MQDKATAYMKGHKNLMSIHGKVHAVRFTKDRRAPHIPVSAQCGQNMGRASIPTDEPINCAKCS